NVTPNGLDAASGDLDSMREQGIRHYGLLTVLSYQKDFQDTLRSTKGVLEFAYATRTFGELRARTAWLLYNVHNLGIGNQCGDRSFYVIRQFCYSLKGSLNVGCLGSNFFVN
ncbi:hypothetical protein MRX96_051206, partial [Rhipicephalus microplus]